MALLSQTTVFRGGATSSSLNYENSTCETEVNLKRQSIEIRTSINSKGGGVNCILLEIKKAGVEQLLRQIAGGFPDLSSVLWECSVSSAKRNLEILHSALEKLRIAKQLVDDLDDVEDYVEQKYAELPIGEDLAECIALECIRQTKNKIKEL